MALGPGIFRSLDSDLSPGLSGHDISETALANLSLTIDSMLEQVSRTWTYEDSSIKNSVIEVVLLTLFSALFTVLAAIAAYILFSKRTRRTPTMMMLISLTVMWVSTAVYWVTTLVAAVTAYDALQDLASWGITRLTDMQNCMHSLLGSDTASASICQPRELGLLGMHPHSSNVSIMQLCTGNVALTVNIAIGDSIVWWRALILWPDSRIVHLTCGVMILITTVMGAIDTRDACVRHSLTTDTTAPCIAGIWQISHSADLGKTGNIFSGDVWGAIAVLCSLSTNVIATMLIAYRAWEHRRAIMSYLKKAAPGRTKVERALALLVESGLLYCALWVVIVVLEFRDWFPGIQGNQNGFYFVMTCCLVPIIGIYPTLVITVCAASESLEEKAVEARARNWSLVLDASESRSCRLGNISELMIASSQLATQEITGTSSEGRKDEKGGTEDVELTV
ncbi:hypothetical protein L227DRAFT_581128 [Lentinus tigrinus ALCF2SS1-6]|uniref:Uncharacterized protein n=2 Tax=Lentinus tigrinus TaxID=5365 RepID=A0A5C2RU19_9APHY|nr:hypothetical protein L227DRAFT_581128 [Lentinus tigrinus ALCF2SS1-6]